MKTCLNDKEYTVFSMDSFYQNAGLVGLIRLLEHAGARAGHDYLMESNRLLVDTKVLLAADLATLYRDTLIHTFCDETAYNRVLIAIDMIIPLLKMDEPNKDDRKKITDLSKRIIDSLSSASYKSGYDILNENGVLCAVPQCLANFKKEKDAASLLRLKESLMEPGVKEVLCFKSIAYNRINMLWEGKSFLNPPNAKKDMVDLYNQDFIVPLKAFLCDDTKKRKDHCIACGDFIHSSEKTSIAFAKDLADDMSRKRSSVWNCTVDMFLCPACAFLYSLAPLGFFPIGRDLVFINDNSDMANLSALNQYRSFAEDSNINASWSRMLNDILSRHMLAAKKRLNNIQVIIRRKQEDRYDMNIIGKDILTVIDVSEKNLKALEKWSGVKDGDVYINVYDEVLKNIWGHRSQYGLIQQLFWISLENASVISCIKHVLHVQFHQAHSLVKKKEEGGDILKSKDLYFATKGGNELRKHIGGNDIHMVDEKVRGLVYQLLNSLKVGDKKGFMDKLLRVYAGYNLPLPTAFMKGNDSDEDFQELGYFFLVGLKGGYYEQNSVSITNEEETGDGK